MLSIDKELGLISAELDGLRFAGLDQNPKAIRDRLASCARAVKRQPPELDVCVTGTNINSEYSIALRFNGEQFFEGFSLGRADAMSRPRIAMLEKIKAGWPQVSGRNEPLAQDVVELVIAAREYFDCGLTSGGPELDALDKALEAFSSRVPYENEPDA